MVLGACFAAGNREAAAPKVHVLPEQVDGLIEPHPRVGQQLHEVGPVNTPDISLAHGLGQQVKLFLGGNDHLLA